MEYTKEQKREYFAKLRASWKANKDAAENDSDGRIKYEAIRKETPGFSISYYGFYWTLRQMIAQNLEGTPYIDAKTFNGWKSAGFRVKKGENSKIEGVTWMAAKSKKEEEDDDHTNLYPKKYALFHKSQVEAIN
ncbi:MAG: hypothetical protein KGI50_06405 [Patescibacteria group bacterium]|nr:hypothetical protein [Patescibacteria group bacterium]MDE2439279.1 hypothetical protein [Patescibacteria group bacterium]